MDNVHNIQSYSGIFAELYDQLIEPSDSERQFFRYFIGLQQGRALELGSGTGQLLIDYIAEGLMVEGVDASRDMLKHCKDKAARKGLHPTLYEQRIEDLNIPHQFQTIYAPAAMFMLITDIDEALRALKRCYEHLVPGGQLLISLFIPWNESREGERAMRLYKDIYRSPDQQVVWWQTLTYQPVEQLRRAIYRFESIKNNTLEHTSVITLEWRWYGKHEFYKMLQQAGFIDITVYGDYTLEQAGDAHDVLIFRAHR